MGGQPCRFFFGYYSETAIKYMKKTGSIRRNASRFFLWGFWLMCPSVRLGIFNRRVLFGKSFQLTSHSASIREPESKLTPILKSFLGSAA